MKVFILIVADVFDNINDAVVGVYSDRIKANERKKIEENKAKTDDTNCYNFRVEEWEVEP